MLLGNFTAVEVMVMSVLLCPATRGGLPLLSGRFLCGAILAPPFAFRGNLQADALVVGDLWATLAAHHVAPVLALVAVLFPRLLA